MSRKSEEEKVAERIATMPSDLRLNLDEIGVYLSRLRPDTNYRRLQEVADSAYFEKENAYVRDSHDPLF